MALRHFNSVLLVLCGLFFAQLASAQTPNGTCLTAEPFCTGTPITFPAGVGTGTAQTGPDYGCLLTQPNPAWYYMEIDQAGNLDIEISNSNNEDIDFILYGPFADQTTPCTALLTAGNTEDCSYSTTATEIANIVGAVPGEFYLMMITNFSNNATDISFTDLPSSTATTNCAIVCPPIDFGVYNGTTTEPLPATMDCDDPAELLLADEDGFNPGVAISPCIVIQVFPTNNNTTLNVEFFEDGTSLGSLTPGVNTNWSGFLSLADPDASHAYVLSEGAATGTNMTYEVLDCHTGTVLASGTWVDDGNPQTVTINPPPNLSGTSTFSVSPATGNPGLTSFDWGGAVWDPSAVPLGTYDITYSWNDGAGNCSGTATQTVTVQNPFTSTFSYTGSPWCQSDADPTPTITGSAGGTFTSSPGGLALNGTTGTIDLSSSGPGTYDITYTTGTSAPCVSATTVQVTINPDQDASFNYAPTTYCADGTDPTPIITGTSGGTFSGTAGLSINSGSGLVDLSASSTGSHTVTYTTAGPCAASSTFGITINPVDDATFSYPQAAYCQGDADPTPSATTSGGTYSAPAQVSINGSTGVIDLSASTPGTYTITYTTGGTCPASSTFSITINPDEDPSFSYPQNQYCADDTDPSATITGTTGGTFSAPAQVSINASNGLIDLSASTPGTYNITYTTGGACSASTTFSITIDAVDDPTFSYPQNQYCESDTDPTPTATTSGGTYSAPAQVSINGSTGVIDLSNSTPGTYNITYTTNGPCPASTTFSITIDVDDDASFGYAQNQYCAGDADPTPTVTGTSGGTFSAPAQVSINASSGLIDLSASTAGTYNVTYTTNGPCPASSTFSITIVAEDDPTFTYPQASYCESDADPTPSPVTAGGSYSAPAGVSINAGTGVIDLDMTTPGTYTITYTTNGTCPNAGTFDVTIVQDDDPSFAYSGGTYCLTGLDPTPTVTGLIGGTFSATGGLVINASTGEIDLDASGVGSYDVTYTTNGTCPQSNTVTINITTAPDASFSYSGPYCQGDPNNAQPNFGGGASAGAFSFAVVSGGPNLVFVNAGTGEIDLSASDAGTYDVTNFIAASGGCAAASSTTQVTIDPQDDPSFTLNSPVCQSDSIEVPSITGAAGGVFSESTGTVVFNSTATGEIDLQATPAGTYTIQYLTNGTCVDSSTVNITINADDDATFSYADNAFCIDETDPLATISGTSGGTFSATPVGLSLDANTGTIDLDASVGNTTYTVTYTTGGVCPQSSTFTVAVDSLDSPLFSYSQLSYCTSDPNQFPTITGTMGGTFAVTPTGLLVDPVTGEVDVVNSPIGNYTISYTTNGACPQFASVPFTITNALDATITPVGPFCSNDAAVQLVAVDGGGTWVGTGVDANGNFDPSSANVGTNEIVYLISGNCGDVDTIQIVVDEFLDPAITSAPANVCEGTGDVTLTAVDAGTWSGPGITDANAGTWNPASAGGPGSYTVYHTTAGNCGGVDSATIVVDPLPSAPVALNETACVDDPIPSLDAIGGGGTFNWYDDAAGTNLVGTGASYTPNVSAVGTYTYYVSEVLGNCEGPLTPVTLTIGGPNALFVPSPASGQLPLDVYFDNQSTGGATYDWNFGHNGASSTLFDPNYEYTDWGVFTATLTVTDSNGCADSYSVDINVEAESEIEVPNIFSPNDDGVNDIFMVGAENVATLTATVQNRWGQVIYSWTGAAGGWDGRLSSGAKAPDGTYFYFIEAVGADGEVYQQTGFFTLIR